VDEVDWLLPLLAVPGEVPGLAVCAAENAEAVAAVSAGLRAAAARLAGGDERPDLGRLDQTRQALAQALALRIADLPVSPDDRALAAAVG
jgi:hypothetical protein